MGRERERLKILPGLALQIKQSDSQHAAHTEHKRRPYKTTKCLNMNMIWMRALASVVCKNVPSNDPMTNCHNSGPFVLDSQCKAVRLYDSQFNFFLCHGILCFCPLLFLPNQLYCSCWLALPGRKEKWRVWEQKKMTRLDKYWLLAHWPRGFLPSGQSQTV